MKKILLSIVAIIFSGALFAQNIQTHYDFGNSRKCVTTTVEMFRPDKLGSTYFFVDMNYNEGDMKGVTNAYWEIARAFNLKKGSSLAAHVEYNGGVFRSSGLGFPINSAFLGGLENTWAWDNYNKTFTIQGLFKSIQGKNDASFQITAVWNTMWFDGRFSFNGFMDFWREDNTAITGESTKYVWLTEPQLWYNFQKGLKGLSVGSEIEMSCNFSGNYKFMCNPTLGMKYTF
ncbi:MAG: DUF5020 family protein [Mangrovibacterium sp.]